MKDVLGNEITIGTKVVFPAPHGYSLLVGTVEKITERKDRYVGYALRSGNPQRAENLSEWFHVRVETDGKYKNKLRKVGEKVKLVRALEIK